jgi:hypothetical protein
MPFSEAKFGEKLAPNLLFAVASRIISQLD